MTARESYQPTMLAEFGLNHLKRNQLCMTLGISDTSQSTPSTTWDPEMIYYQGGPYAFDGSTTAVDGTFVFDFTDIAPSGSIEKRYYVGMYDSSAGDIAELFSYKLIDVLNGNIETVCYEVPQFGDTEQVYAYVDYYDDGNIPPVAVATASPLSGEAQLSVNFDGSVSYDTDGNITSYHWNFGDGATDSGAIVEHTYNNPGNYTATLTVTDNGGATDSATVGITVIAPPPKAIYVSGITMSVAFKGINVNATAKVTIIDEDGSPVSNATVTGQWSGLVSGTASGITSADGSVSFMSPTSKKSGIFTFTVTNVSASGYTYPDQIIETWDSISTDGSTNQNPVADAQATPTSGNASLAVIFDGTGSYDPDGSVESYEWNYGDNSTGSGATPTHTYKSDGMYNATLTVTDNEGATDLDSVIITVGSSGPLTKMYVADIAMSLSYKGVNAEAKAEVTIRDENGIPVANATVTGQWSGLTSSSATGLTGADGTVTFVSKSKNNGTFTFKVTNVTASGYDYYAGLNIETSDSITNP